jgi:hypothetical protein
VRPTTAVVVVLTAALAGCGGSSGETNADKKVERQLEQVGHSPTFVCIDKATEKPLPAGFPATFALPNGSVVIGSEIRSGGRVIVYAVSRHDVKSTLHSMQQIPAAGFKLTEGEVEHDDAESNWKGNGYIGRWAIRQMPDCTDQTSVTVLAQKQ